MICLTISTQYSHVMDRQTDRPTSRDSIDALCIASCGKKQRQGKVRNNGEIKMIFTWLHRRC